MTHPCADHACDHCSICEAGICCGSVSTAQHAELDAEHHKLYIGLAVAIVYEAGSIRSLSELVRADVARQGRGLLANPSRLALPAAIPDHSRKEAIRVPIPRTNR